MLLPATADEADDDEFDADKEDKEDGGNPNRAILTDRARRSPFLASPNRIFRPRENQFYSSFVECGTPPPSVPQVLLLSLALQKSSFLFFSRLRERNEERERETRGNGDNETHNTHAEMCGCFLVDFLGAFDALLLSEGRIVQSSFLCVISP